MSIDTRLPRWRKPPSYGEKIDEFFREHREFLGRHYPGLTSKRLRQELLANAVQAGISSDEFFSLPFIEREKGPINHFLDMLMKGVPLEYITGRAFFYRSEFTVSRDVLIPRNETEILVEKAVSFAMAWGKKSDEYIKIADVGTGSGAIGLSILRELNRPCLMFATDISLKALKMARRNYFHLRFAIPRESEFRPLCCDRLDDVAAPLHLIVSNPPYIKRGEDRDLVHHQVDNYEPHLALYLDDNIYDSWFKGLFEQAFERLVEEGVLLMEGHENHLIDLMLSAKAVGFVNVSLINDYNGLPRFLIAHKPTL
jgi:release factor glutamine methyltransferase